MVTKIIKFSAEWCGPCKIMKPIIESVLKDEKFKNIEFIEIDIDKDPQHKTDEYQIRNIPTLLLLDENDKKLEKIVGGYREKELKEKIEKYL